MHHVRSLFTPLTPHLLWLGLALLALLTITPAWGQTALISHAATSTTTAGNGFGLRFTISADGNYVVFESSATNLVTGQANGDSSTNVFLYNRATAALTLVSHRANSATAAGDDDSDSATISADGRFVAYRSSATDLVANQIDGESGSNVYLYDRTTGTNTLVSHTAASALTTGDERSFNAEISADGNYIAFASDSTNLIAGQVDNNANNNGGATDIFLYNRATGTNALISHASTSTATTANTASIAFDISADGRFVTFDSPANNLVAGVTDSNGGGFDIYLYDRTTTANTLISHNATSTTTTANNTSGIPFISADGNYVVYRSFATNVVTGQIDNNGSSDVFLYNRATGTSTLVSHIAASTTTTGNGDTAVRLVIDDSGRFVAYTSFATNLIANQTDTNSGGDVFLYDRTTNANTLVSHSVTGDNITANGSSSIADLDADGSHVVLASNATNLIVNQTDTNGLFDIFLYDRAADTSTLVSRSAASATTTGNDNSNDGTISADGAYVAFPSESTNLVTGQSDIANTMDGFLFTASATPPVALPSLSIADAAPMVEGDSGTTNASAFTVTLSEVAAQEIRVFYQTQSGSAEEGVDFQSVPNANNVNAQAELVFAPGETSKTITVPIIGDTIAEANELIVVSIYRPTPDNVPVARSQALGTIVNDDTAPTLTISDVQVLEGNSGTPNATFIVSLSRTSSQGVFFEYSTASGSAVAGEDFAPVKGNHTFAPGETSFQILVPINGDTLPEPNELFPVLIYNPINATVATGQGLGTITNDDGTVPAGFAVSGTITLSVGGPAPGVMVVLQDGSGNQLTATTDANGTYAFAGVPRGNIVVRPVSTTLEFTPALIFRGNIQSDQNGLNFTAQSGG